MKTLKQNLQEIVDEELLSEGCPFICNHLTWSSEKELQQYKEMASNYAKENWEGDYVWWKDASNEIVIHEKYRFIKDLIKQLK